MRSERGHGGSPRRRALALAVAAIVTVATALVVQPGTAGAGPATTFEFRSIDDPLTEDRSDTFFQVRAVDASGAVDTGYTGTVRFSSTDPDATLPPDITFVAGDAGVVTYSGDGNLVWGTPGEQTLTATDTGDPSITGSHANITVRSDAPTAIALQSIDDPITEERADTFFEVRMVNAFGEASLQADGRTVHFTSNDSQATIPPDFTYQADNRGRMVFSGNENLVWATPGERTLTATDTVDASITGSRANITVRSDAPTKITFSSLDDPIEAGASDTFFDVWMENAFGEASLQSAGHTVHFTSSDPLATLPPDFTYQADNRGRKVFSGNGNLVWATPGEQTLTATDTAQASITGSRANITVTGDQQNPPPSTTTTTTAPPSTTTTTTAAPSPGSTTTTTSAPSTTATTVSPGTPSGAGTEGSTAGGTTEQVAGQVAAGDPLTIRSCGFRPNSNVNLVLNGGAVGSDAVATDGCTTQLLEMSAERIGGTGFAVVGLQLAQTNPEAQPSVRIDGRTVPVVYGTNVLAASGTAVTGAPRVVTSTFDVPRPSAVINRTFSSPQAVAGQIARAGARLLSPAGFAVALMALGALLTMGNGAVRRRSRRTARRAGTAMAGALEALEIEMFNERGAGQ